MSATNIIRKCDGWFRDFSAEKVVGRDDLKVYANSLSVESSGVAEDCHEVAVVDADGVEHRLGEVLDSLSAAEMNEEIAARIESAGI